MALEGTIKDFGLGDILQLIGIQRKTGILTLENEADSVSVRFLEGRVVGADTEVQNEEVQLGTVLVRTGKITDAQLNEALELQKKTLQRLGHILVKLNCISEEELVEALRLQALQVIYQLFRWREGNYRVQMLDNVDYDERHFTPISPETILMEGARMIDEWPIIERRIKSPQMVFAKTETAQTLAMDAEPSIIDTGLDLDAVFDGLGTEEKDEEERKISLSPEERKILEMVDGKRSVYDINQRSDLGEFDTYKTLYDLLTRDLVVEVKRARAVVDTGRASRNADRVVGLATGLALVLAVGASLATLSTNPFVPWKAAGQAQTTDQLRVYASHARLARVQQGIQVFYLDQGRFPDELSELADEGYLEPEDLVDPWGLRFGYQISPGAYTVYGHGADGEPSPQLTLSHRFTAAQRMVLGAGVPEPPQQP